MKSTTLHNLIIYSILGLILLGCTSISAQVDLSGQWNFRMDSLDQGEVEQWYLDKLDETITLPGSMVENGKGNPVDLKTHWTGNMWNDSLWYKSPKYANYRKPDNLKVSFWLTPERKYHGAAWYQKNIIIPEDWQDKNILLELERAHWETTIWIDNIKVGSRNSLATAHKYKLPESIKPGKHRISIRVDNRIKDINVGKDAHSISDNTQSNWNGLVGSLTLEAKPKVYIDVVKIVPDLETNSARVYATILNTTGVQQDLKVSVSAKLKNTDDPELNVKSEEFTIDSNQEISINYPMGNDYKLWDEFNPEVYDLTVIAESKDGIDIQKTKFGMREFHAIGKHFAINGNPVFLRGTLECAIFPKTGYPPTQKSDWARIFNIIKSHGLNHMRFHSWCPPEAAFDAADEAGVYLQIEASAWTTIGDGEPIDEWIFREAKDILDNYGNHPSFVMMAYGNEPGGEFHEEYLKRFVSHFKKENSTKVYTGAAGWPFLRNADYWNTPKPRIQQWNENLQSIINNKPPQTDFDYSSIIDTTSIPVVSHEIGQWCVYPNFKEMDKYTGVLKPKNFEIFKETLEESHMGHLSDSLLLASGKLQTLCYKADIEAALRTKDFGGFQLLDLHDFPGQGTALVGILDSFWDEKGYVSPEEFKSFSGPTVPLVRLKQKTFLNTDTLEASVEIAHFGEDILKNVKPKWMLQFEDDAVYAKGELIETTIENGNGIRLGEISVPLQNIDKARRLILSVRVGEYTNKWDVWVYPDTSLNTSDTNLRFVESLKPETVDYLTNGGNVLLSLKKGSLNPDKGGDISVGFSSIFWNTSWTKGQEPHTLGILCDPEHPALSAFPTEFHSNWQWWDAMSNSNAIILDDFNPDLKPIVRVIDDWFENRRLALIFEVNVGKGKLIISGIDLHTNLSRRKEARQLLYSLKTYMNSEDFNPQIDLDIASIQNLYKYNEKD
ncbi:sugar-binding domain-containing protein [Christiangramia marina]|uniref:sugar-binding domain-containing protein n=1 Tax=Christiangramia marina TaxID=409436 RepID=UPI003AA93A8C